MPLHIIRNDITKVRCDAIVNAANNSLLGGGGVDGAIHRAAGEELLNECKTLGGCATGDAKITKGYKLPCRYVIHTVGPIWRGGSHGEKQALESCYDRSLSLAKENGCETVAFPLISSGVYGYPKAEAIKVAVDRISEFLKGNEMVVYLVVFDHDSFAISDELYKNVAEYIDDNYMGARNAWREESRRINRFSNESRALGGWEDIVAESEIEPISKSISPYLSRKKSPSLIEMLSRLDDGFSVTLLKLIDLKGMTDVECYKRANVSKQTWYKIMNEKNYRPSKVTVISFAIALRLTLEETNDLLATVGLTLSKSSKFDIIIEYFLINGIYDVFTINETLFKFDQVCLGV